VQTADAYGVLKLPTGSYNNVLRIKKVQVETDTVSGAASTSSMTSYLWFDTLHHAPLFRIDSSVAPSGSSQTAMYLAMPEAVNQVGNTHPTYSGYMNNNELVLTGGFETGKSYQVEIYNLIGTKMFTGDFTASGNYKSFDMGGRVVPGIYVVSIVQKNDPSSRQVIKVVQQ